MISKIFKADYLKWQEEGITPTLEDIILLNKLGISIENGTEAYNFGALPRCAFLGDYTLWEPTVAKRIYIDQARLLISNNATTQMYFLAYALHTPLNELPNLQKISELTSAISKFTDEVLINMTDTQIFAAVSYCLSGLDWRNEPDYQDEEHQKTFHLIYDIPTEIYSNSKQLLGEALLQGMSDDIANFTSKEVERMIIVAAIHEGADILKNQHAENCGKYYQAAAKIHKRLLDEKKAKEDKIQQNDINSNT